MSVTFLDQSSLTSSLHITLPPLPGASLTRPLVEIYVTDLLALSVIRKLLTNYQDAESLKWRNGEMTKDKSIK